MKRFRDDFPIFEKAFDPQEIIYLDSAATTLKPKTVIERINQFYEYETANVARGNHFLSEHNSQEIEKVREKTASFINAQSHEIIFTHNCTDSINIISHGLNFKTDDEVIISLLEHHSNFLPWKNHAKVKIANLTDEGLIDLDHLESLITNKTKIIAFTYASNITGNVQPVEEIIKIAKKHNLLTLIDAAQIVSHFPINVNKLNCDFLAFSSHKMFGPSGVGLLYVKEENQKMIDTRNYGGGMANRVDFQKITYQECPYIFEAGTPNIEGILGFGKALDYITEQSFEKITSYLNELEKYLREELEKLDFIHSISSYSSHHLPIFTIVPKNQNANIAQLSQILSDHHNIIIRSGFHCSQLIYNKKQLQGGMRISLHIYNTKKDIDKCINAMKKLKAFF